MALRKLSLAVAVLFFSAATHAFDYETSLEVGLEQRYYPQEAEQFHSSFSVVVEPELYLEWDGGTVRSTIKPFARWDDRDHQRTHIDAREASVQWLLGDVELMAGIGQEFWGTLEGVHLVDIINQTDFVENIDGEDKLGQAMFKLAWLNDWGNFEAWAMPFFRERTFPGPNGRPSAALPVDEDLAQYESKDERDNLDYALRYSNAFGGLDLGISWFDGTSRDPTLVPVPFGGVPQALAPYYALVEQIGVDFAWALGGWLLKGEYINRQFTDSNNDFNAYGLGAEYTFVSIFGGDAELGVLVEYYGDERDELPAPALFQNDVLIGTRWVFNDVQSTELLAGVVLDQDHDGYAIQLEATRRLGDAGALALEYRKSDKEPAGSPFQSFEDDELLQLEYRHYF